jgi:hypothetical protein
VCDTHTLFGDTRAAVQQITTPISIHFYSCTHTAADTVTLCAVRAWRGAAHATRLCECVWRGAVPQITCPISIRSCRILCGVCV